MVRTAGQRVELSLELLDLWSRCEGIDQSLHRVTSTQRPSRASISIASLWFSQSLAIVNGQLIWMGGQNLSEIAPQITALLIVVVILLTLFLICREIVCWYWKINRVVELLERIANSLETRDRFK